MCCVCVRRATVKVAAAAAASASRIENRERKVKTKQAQNRETDGFRLLKSKTLERVCVFQIRSVFAANVCVCVLGRCTFAVQ